ncbi:MAG: ATP-binding cassette domain-containing protein [Verrucomicrobia bacterium]|nr:ATP-binding cassette domain-containing protein [Verrucomicrobiota bacterium]
MTNDAVRVEGLSFSYGRTPVLRDVSLSIQRGCIACFTGPNGGGKSTLLRLILGLLKPQAGQISVLGTTPEAASMRIGYMPQQVQFDPRFPITVMQIVLMGRLRGNRPGFYSRQDRFIASTCLEEVDLANFANTPFSHLSGGQKQRVLIARALAVQPEMLLLDEPTAMVDNHIEARLLEQLRTLHARMTIVLVSHDMHFLQQLVQVGFHVNGTVQPAQQGCCHG